jgi:hypothetical protein
VNVERRARALQAVEQATELPMLLLSVAIIVLLLLPPLSDPSESTKVLLTRLEWLIWAAFALELSARPTSRRGAGTTCSPTGSMC